LDLDWVKIFILNIQQNVTSISCSGGGRNWVGRNTRGLVGKEIEEGKRGRADGGKLITLASEEQWVVSQITQALTNIYFARLCHHETVTWIIRQLSISRIVIVKMYHLVPTPESSDQHW
jgi:hypothetical protein